jgi:hypothetical protein
MGIENRKIYRDFEGDCEDFDAPVEGFHCEDLEIALV